MNAPAKNSEPIPHLESSAAIDGRVVANPDRADNRHGPQGLAPLESAFSRQAAPMPS